MESRMRFVLLLALWASMLASVAQADEDPYSSLQSYLKSHPIRVHDQPSVAKFIERLGKSSRLQEDGGLGRAHWALRTLASARAPCTPEHLEAIRFMRANERESSANAAELFRYLGNKASWECVAALADEANRATKASAGLLRRGLLNDSVWNLRHKRAPGYGLTSLASDVIKEEQFYVYPEQFALALLEIVRPQVVAAGSQVDDDGDSSYQSLAKLALANFDGLYSSELVEACAKQQASMGDIFPLARYMSRKLVNPAVRHTFLGDMPDGLKEQLVIYGLCGSLRGRRELQATVRQCLERVAELGFDGGLQPDEYAATSTTTTTTTTETPVL